MERDGGIKGGTCKSGGKEAEKGVKITTENIGKDSFLLNSLPHCGPGKPRYYSGGNINCNLEGSLTGS